MEFTDLTLECLQTIFSLLPGRSWGVAASVSHAWREFMRDDLLWKELCARELGLRGPEAADGSLAPTYRQAFESWQPTWAAYGKLGPRAVRAWRQVESWTAQHLPAVRESLRPGASEAELDAAEAALGLLFPPAFRALYRCHDGQQLQMDTELDRTMSAAMHDSMSHGVLGGYGFYDHMVSMRLMPLSRIVRWTTHLFASSPASERGSELMFSCSFDLNRYTLLDADSGQVLAVLPNKHFVAAVPADAAGSEEKRDGLMRWFEEYANRLSRGAFQAANLMSLRPSHPTLAINLFGAVPPAAVEAVTGPLRLRAAPLYVPEHSCEQPLRHVFAYSIRMYLLSEAEQEAACPGMVPLLSAQLQSRHWIICGADGRVVDEIRGDGVVGEYPVLQAGGVEFIYESCNHQSEARGSMEGSFTFVPGSLEAPQGAPIVARCPRFELVVPDYIF